MSNKTSIHRQTHVYIGRDDGGCCLAISSDYRDRHTGQRVADMIAKGLIVERVDWQTYTDMVSHEANFLKCGCPKLQPGLSESE